MGDAADKVAYYRIDLAGNAREFAGEAGADLKELSERVNGSTAYIRQMAAAQRALKGDTEDIVAARNKLKSAIAQEQIQVARANKLFLDSGTTMQKLADETRAAEKAKADAIRDETLALARLASQNNAVRDAVRGVGGPLADIQAKMDGLTGLLKKAGDGFGFLKIAAWGSVAAVLAAGAALAVATVALVKWIVASSDVAKSQQLVREAFAGSEENATRLGEQVAALAAKVPTATEEINKLGTQLMTTRLSGAAIVDSLNAIGQASAATKESGKDIGPMLQEWITRGQLLNRMQLSPLEMQGSGLRFDDVAKTLGQQMGVGVEKAREALYLGRVKIEDGAKALRTVVETQFGKLNAQKMLSLDAITQTWHKHLQTLTSGVDFSKIIAPLGKIMAMFDDATIAGHAMKGIITDIGGALGSSFSDAVPFVQEFVDKMTLGALKVQSAYLDAKLWFMKTFGSDVFANVNAFSVAMDGLKVAAFAAAGAFGALAIAAAPVVGPFLAVAAAITGALFYMDKFVSYVTGTDWDYLGKHIGTGIVEGFSAAVTGLIIAGVETAGKLKDAFKNALGIHSPSTVFAEYGRQTAAGYAQGVDAGSGQAQAAVETMVVAPSGKGEGRSSSGPISLVVNINVQGGGNADAVAAKLSSPSVLEQFTAAVEELCQGAGIPTQGVSHS